jgi:hypothetical protein
VARFPLVDLAAPVRRPMVRRRVMHSLEAAARTAMSTGFLIIIRPGEAPIA